VIRSPLAFREACASARSAGRAVGFVPTMGAFHEGHRSLIRRARTERGTVAVSIFVNPLQFGPSEDLAAYPRDLERDLEDARTLSADLAFAPSEEEMWPGGAPAITVDPGPLAARLEGGARPGHFRGVATVVAKLFQLVGPCRAYFGEKDAQQLAVVRAMVRDLAFPIEVVGCPTVREPDGLALSSRNVYLSEEERRAAPCLYRALSVAVRSVEDGQLDARTIEAEMRGVIEAEPLAGLDYVAVVDEETFEDVERIGRPARALVAARFGRARLIDNIALTPRVLLDRVQVQEAALAALRDDLAGGEDAAAAAIPEARTALAVIRSRSPGVLAGLPIAAEVFTRLGVRLRDLVREGATLGAGERVAEVGGPLRAILAGRPTAFRLLERLSAVASGRLDPAEGDALDAYARSLRPRPLPAVRDNGPRFELQVLEEDP
jgi:pantoate--beta-alanine ligase